MVLREPTDRYSSATVGENTAARICWFRYWGCNDATRACRYRINGSYAGEPTDIVSIGGNIGTSLMLLCLKGHIIWCCKSLTDTYDGILVIIGGVCRRTYWYRHGRGILLQEPTATLFRGGDSTVVGCRWCCEGLLMSLLKDEAIVLTVVAVGEAYSARTFWLWFEGWCR